MSELLIFFQQNGLWLTLIAIAGVIVLGILKYLKVFSKLDEKMRHVCYLAISVGLSVIGSCIYIACMHQFSTTYMLALSGAIFALNQTFYSIYDNTTLKELLFKFISWCKGHKKDIEDVAKEIDDQINK